MLVVLLPHATFAVLFEAATRRVFDAAPIARWAVGRNVDDVARYFSGRGAQLWWAP